MAMDDKTLQVASMRVSALVVTEDDELTTFRRKRLGHLSNVDPDRLKVVRDFVRAVAVNLSELDEDETWQRMADAARALGIMPGAVGDPGPEQDEEGVPDEPVASAGEPPEDAKKTISTEMDEEAPLSAPSLSAPPGPPRPVPPPPPLGATGPARPSTPAASPWSRAAGIAPAPPPRPRRTAPSEIMVQPEPASLDVRSDEDDEMTMLKQINLSGTLDGSSDREAADGARAVLPFRESRRQVPPSKRSAVDLSAGLPFGASPSTSEGAREDASRWSHVGLEDYAELCVVIREYPAYADQARKRFGVEDEASQASVDRHFEQRFAEDPAEQQEFYAAYERVRQRFSARR